MEMGSDPAAGMKQGSKTMTMMTNDTFETACTKAVARLLLGNRKLKAGVMLTGGGQLDTDGKIWLGRQAASTGADIVHLEYGAGSDGRHSLLGMILFLPRETGCHIQSGCRLWLSGAGNRGVILPQPGVRGHFRLATREIIHIDGKPAADVRDGMMHAEAWLARRLASAKADVDDGQCRVWATAA